MKPLPRPQNIHQSLMTWYRRMGRDLPWRTTRDPYLIAVSEVMLQQTQVDRVVPKFLAWRRAWPTTKALAQAPLSDVLKLWSGLGYNSRAMRLRLAARVVVEKYDGQWPKTVEELQSLPGFGPYTAGAVATFAFRQRVPVIDTNIRRVIGRLFFGPAGAPTEKKLQATVERVLPTSRTDLWNHALMDIGATVCVARKPACDVCPLKKFCRAYPEILSAIPAPRKKFQPKFEVTDRFWRGRIIATAVKNNNLSLAQLLNQLRLRGKIQHHRMVKLVQNLVADGLLQNRRGRISISS